MISRRFTSHGLGWIACCVIGAAAPAHAGVIDQPFNNTDHPGYGYGFAPVSQAGNATTTNVGWTNSPTNNHVTITVASDESSFKENGLRGAFSAADIAKLDPLTTYDVSFRFRVVSLDGATTGTVFPRINVELGSFATRFTTVNDLRFTGVGQWVDVSGQVTTGADLSLGNYTLDLVAFYRSYATGESGVRTVVFDVDDFTIAAVPEPASVCLVGMGALLVLGRRRAGASF